MCLCLRTPALQLNNGLLSWIFLCLSFLLPHPPSPTFSFIPRFFPPLALIHGCAEQGPILVLLFLRSCLFLLLFVCFETGALSLARAHQLGWLGWLVTSRFQDLSVSIATHEDDEGICKPVLFTQTLGLKLKPQCLQVTCNTPQAIYLPSLSLPLSASLWLRR